MIFVFRKQPSDGAKLLALALEGRKISKLPKRVLRQDVMINWGSQMPRELVCRILNNAPIRSKVTDTNILRKAGVPTITISPTMLKGYIGRDMNHAGGTDILNPTTDPDYYVEKEELVKEFRVHSFMGKSIRAGKKIHRDDFKDPHPWVRSWDGGWRISYDGKSVKNRHRKLAHDAVAALGLEFGAVDIGQRKDKSLIVLEVNRAPGLEGGTVNQYAEAVQRWMENNR